jgi:hypothetical protein
MIFFGEGSGRNLTEILVPNRVEEDILNQFMSSKAPSKLRTLLNLHAWRHHHCRQQWALPAPLHAILNLLNRAGKLSYSSIFRQR